MNAIAQFNQLGGKTVSRESLISLKELAYLEGSDEIIIRIDNILNKFPEGTEFDLEVEKPVIEIGLGAAQHSGLYREALDDCGRLQKGYKFENGFVVKVSTGQADKKKLKKATAKEVEKPKKSASNYGKKRPFTKSAKVISIANKTELQQLEESNPELLKSSLYSSFSDAEKLKFLKVRTEIEEKPENNNFDFLFEATGKGYYIKTFLELPTSRSVKFREISDSVEGLRYYNASDKGLDELQKIYKNSKYGDKNSFDSKDLLNPNDKPTRTPKKATNYGKKRDYESVTSKYTFSKDDIPYQTAYNAHSGTSFSPEKRAVSEQNAYFQHLEQVFKSNRKKAVALGKLDEFETKFARYKEGYLKRFLEHVRSKIGFFSTMIAGPANFPVRRMEKKSNAINAKLDALIDYQKYADFFKPESTIIKTGSETALSKLEAKLQIAEENHARMLAGNKLLKKLRADKNTTENDYKDAFINLGFDLATAKKEASYMFNYSYAGFFTANSSAKIRTIKSQIALEKRLKEKAVVSAENPTEITFKGGSIENDYTDNRIKVFFDSIPDVEIRSFLKKAGQAFKWSPKNKAWQRQLNTYYSGNRTDLYKFLGVTEPEPTKKKVVEQDEPKTPIKAKSPQLKKAPSNIQVLDLRKITLDTKRFQNRSELNENIVNNIVSNFSETELDPLIVWKQKSKTFLLAGHHRYEGLTRLKKKTAPVKYFEGTEKQAIEFAKVKSNANRSLETPIERAKIYREMRSDLSKKEIEEKAKAIEGKNASTILNLSFLNPSGIVIESLHKISSGDEQNKSTLSTVADWIGDARRTYTELTHTHEKEMFDYLMNKESSKRVTTKADFKHKIYSLVGKLDFDDIRPLNLNRFKYTTEGEKVYQDEENKLKSLLLEVAEQKTNLIGRLSDPTRSDFISEQDNSANKFAAVKLLEYNDKISKYQKDLIELSRNKGKYTAASNQPALFGTMPEVISFAVPEIQKEPILYVPTVVPAQEKILVSQATKEAQKTVNSKYKTAIDRELENAQPVELFKIKGDLAKFLGKIEIKPVQSLAITLDSGEGGGKTHTIYQWANEFYESGYKPIIWSLEEHANSSLSIDKANKYFGENRGFIPIESERENEAKADTLKRISDSVKDFDVIFIDSWTKVMELDKTLNFDQDLRKKFNGKLFVVILQRTSSGDIRGGTKVGFDGDIICKFFIDRDDFRNNYIYNHKNRYNDYMPISELKYSPYYGKLLDIPSEETEEEVLFSEEVEKI